MKKAKQSHVAGTKSSRAAGDWHVSHTSLGMGDYYGSGIRAKVGKMRDSYSPEITPLSKKGLKTPPKSVV